MQKYSLLTLVALLGVLALGSCGSSNVGNNPPVFNPGNQASSAFQLEVMDETFDFGASAGSIEAAVSLETDTHVVVDIQVDNAQGLKALYFNLNYDSSSLRPMVAEPTSEMGNKADLLNVMGVVEPGQLQYGQVLLNPDYRLGYSGSGTLTQISFRKEASPRTVSKAPLTAKSAVSNLNFDGTDTLTWHYSNQGDYDQNGETNAADLTPIAQNFQQVADPNNPGTPFLTDDKRSQIDGDGNGEINGADITSIAQNLLGSALGGFNIYSSAAAADYPNPGSGANGAGATTVGNLTLAQAVNAGPPIAGRLRFEFVIAAPTANDYYWVRATDGTELGWASNLVGGDPANSPALSLVTAANGGAGTSGDPYQMVDTTDYTFQLLDAPGGNDVSTDAASVFSVNPPAAGNFTQNVLNIATGFVGAFTVTATYNGTPNHPSTDVYCTTQTGGTPAPVISKDDTDPDWAGVVGTGADETNALILRTDAFNPTYTLDFTLKVTVGGNPGTNSDFDWEAFPPFIVQDAAAFTADATAGTFQAWDFTSGYLFAQDATLQNSNNLYVAVNSLPTT